MKIRAYKLLLSSALALSVSLTAFEASDARGKRSSGGGGGGGGGGSGVVLQTPNPTNPMEHNNRGVELGSKGLWPDAIREHEAALNGDPANNTFRQNLSSAHLRYGDLLAGKHKWYEAIREYREALYCDPNNAPADYNLDNAIKAMGKNPTDYKVRESMADDADISGNFPVAIVEFRKCVRMRDNGMSNYRLSRALYKQGKTVEAYEQLRTAINKEWKLPEEKKELSTCHQLMGEILWDVTQAAKKDGRGKIYLKRLYNVGTCYRRAVTINRDNSDAVRGLIEAAKEAVAVKDSFDNHMMLAGAYLLGGDLQRAKAEYARCWQLSPKSPALHKARRVYHMIVVKSPIASPALIQDTLTKVQKELDVSPDDPELLVIYAYGKQKLGDEETSKMAFKKALAINPYILQDDKNTGKTVEEQLAKEKEKKAKTKIAKADGEEGAESEGDEDKAAEAAGGSNGDKKKELPKAPEKPKVAKNKALYDELDGYLSKNDFDNGLKKGNEYIDKNPEDGHLWLLLAHLYYKSGDLDAALVAYRTSDSLKEPGVDKLVTQVENMRVQKKIYDAKELIAKGELVKARNELKEATQWAPKNVDAHRLYSDVLRKLKEIAEADKEKKIADDLEGIANAPSPAQPATQKIADPPPKKEEGAVAKPLELKLDPKKFPPKKTTGDDKSKKISDKEDEKL
ncbi:MAG: tetratricopeptide repeat protein [Candidatus Melainabacteria bacterium]|nr:tetratricopeptide repeat protein [Candidatus Melainabacteria bacterium]